MLCPPQPRLFESFGGAGFRDKADRTTGDFRSNSAALDVDLDGNPDFGYTATGTEQLAEIYYRVRLNSNLELTPDFQLIRHPGGDKTATTSKVVGLRAKASF